MADKTGIPYLDATWNPLAGCADYPSPAGPCAHCWARRVTSNQARNPKLTRPEGNPYAGLTAEDADGALHWTGEVRLLEHKLEDLRHWKHPRVVGVCFNSDLFRPKVPLEYLGRVFDEMDASPQHTYVLLTKRYQWLSIRMAHLRLRGELPDTIWPGVTVWDEPSLQAATTQMARIEHRWWVSYEPALGGIGAVAWAQAFSEGCAGVVIGCESGKGRRLPQCPTCDGTGWDQRLDRDDPCPRCSGTGYAAWEWARSTRDACQAAGARFYLKQLPEATGRVIAHPELDGRQCHHLQRHLDLPVSRAALTYISTGSASGHEVGLLQPGGFGSAGGKSLFALQCRPRRMDVRVSCCHVEGCVCICSPVGVAGRVGLKRSRADPGYGIAAGRAGVMLERCRGPGGRTPRHLRDRYSPSGTHACPWLAERLSQGPSDPPPQPRQPDSQPG